MWFCKKRYNEKEVQYIISSILQQTVDRQSIRRIIEENLGEIIGPKCMGQCFEKLNSIEEIADPEQVKLWMDRIEELRKNKIF
jgi:hypothetical protein